MNRYAEAIVRSCSVEKVFLEIFAKLTGKYLCQSLFFITLQALKFLNKKSNTWIKLMKKLNMKMKILNNFEPLNINKLLGLLALPSTRRSVKNEFLAIPQKSVILLKSDSSTGVLLWVLQLSWYYLFCRVPPDDCLYKQKSIKAPFQEPTCIGCDI